jgi:4-amino-4-deoxy-L-arabinose transferase-like glycosyltransferase
MKNMLKTFISVFHSKARLKALYPHGAVCGAILLALFLSFTNIDARSLWFDEAYSVGLTALDWSVFQAILINHEANMGLYSVLLKVWVGIMGSSEYSVRSLSALTAVGSVPILYLIGCRLFNTRVGITAALLLAANPFFIRYSQEARSYSLVLFLVSLAGYFFLRFVDAPSVKNRTIYICATVLAAYSHFFALLIPVCHAASLTLMKQKAVRLLNITLTFSIIGVLVLPLIVFILAKDSGQVSWIPPVDILSLPRLFFAFSGLVDLPMVIVCLLLFPIGLFNLLQKSWKQPLSRKTWQSGFTVIWLVLPIAIVMIVSLLKPLFVTRYFIVSFPPFILITSLGLACITRKWNYRLGTAVVVILSINAVFTSYRASTVADWKSASSFLFSSSLSNDALFIYRDTQFIPYAYYKEKLSGQRLPPECFYPTTPLRNLFMDSGASPPDRQHIKSLLEKRDRAWLIICEDTPERLFGFLSLFGTNLHPVPLSGKRPENRQGATLRDNIRTLYRYHREWRFERIRLYLFYNET